MSGTEEDMPAMNGPAAPFTVERKPGWKSPRFFIFAALATAIFIYDSILYDKIHSPPAPIVFRNMSSGYVHASSGFTNLISTVCWIAGFCILVSGCRKIYGVWRRKKDDPAFAPHSEMVLLFFLIGIGLMAYPLVHQIVQPSYSYYDAYYQSYYSSTQQEPDHSNLKTFSVYSWYFGVIAFFLSSFALKEAQRQKGSPESAAVKDKAAFRFMAGFIMTALPFACTSFVGVELW